MRPTQIAWWTIPPGLARPESYLTRVEQMKRYDGLVLARQRASRDSSRIDGGYSAGWCCQMGLNHRPLHYQWSALPLSYGSMPGIARESAPKKAPTGGPVLATRPPRAQARGNPEKAPKWGQNTRTPAICGLLPLGKLRPIRFCVSSTSAAERAGQADRDLEFGHFAGYTMRSGNSGAKRSRSGEAMKRCRPSRGLMWPQAPVQVFAHRRFLADDRIKTGSR
jgi:hypothetical protein